jgi:GNAT superfamily N-acetyltransferase
MGAPLRHELTIREAGPGDGAGLARVWLNGATFYQVRFPDDFQIPSEADLVGTFEASLGKPQPSDRRSTVATHGEEIVGMAAGSLEPPHPSSRYQWNPSLGTMRLHIDNLVVSSEHWREGIGRQLVDDLERWAREEGASEAFTDTYYDSPVSRPFWEGTMGYRPRAVILRKRL